MTTPITQTSAKHIVLTAGGTGGHMFPARALAEELLSRGLKVSLITDSRGGGFGDDLPEVAVQRVSAGGVAGGGALRKAMSLVKLGLGAIQARKMLRAMNADAVVAFGGYASVPAALAGSQMGLPLFLHEQNAVLGRANRLLASRAGKICTSFHAVSAIQQSWRDKVVLTGNPVRPAITALRDQPYPALDENTPIHLLVTGGSQGATIFNTLVPEALCRLPEALRQRIKISQQVRGEAEAEIAALYEKHGIDAELRPFFSDMPQRLADAHLMICRSGASTVTELTAAGRPAILVPYPYATDDHQTANARDFSDAGAGWLMPQSSLQAETLAERLESLFTHTKLLRRAATCARDHAITEAARNLADVVCGSLSDNGDEPSTSANVSTGAAA